MGILVDYQEAKAALIASKSVIVSSDTDSILSAALENFAFSRLEKRNRVALILAGMFGGEAEIYLSKADELIPYADKNFENPYMAPTTAINFTAEDIQS
jgi:hypothetical protein